jgi:hypothetical protein
MTREYNFELPYQFSGFAVHFMSQRLQAAGVWDNIPIALKNRINEASAVGDGLTATQEDLDSIDDETWNRISTLFS